MRIVRGVLVAVVCASVLAGCVGVSVNKRSAPDSRSGATPASGGASGFGTASVLGEAAVSEDFGGPQATFEVAYLNHTANTLSSVTVWCRVYDADDFQIGSGRWPLSSERYGPMAPGFKTRRHLTVALLEGSALDHVMCEVTAAD